MRRLREPPKRTAYQRYREARNAAQTYAETPREEFDGIRRRLSGDSEALSLLEGEERRYYDRRLGAIETALSN